MRRRSVGDGDCKAVVVVMLMIMFLVKRTLPSVQRGLSCCLPVLVRDVP